MAGVCRLLLQSRADLLCLNWNCNAMNRLRPAIFALLSVAQSAVMAAPVAPERESNLWPVNVRPRAGTAGNLCTWSGGGPLFFSQPANDPTGQTVSGFRPFWVQFTTPQGDPYAGHFLYPLFSYSQDEIHYRWSIFELVRRHGRRAGAPSPETDFDQRYEFEVFPFWFEREFAEPALNYRALFPIHGTVRQKFGIERLSWTLFPLLVENEKRGAITTHTPWPFVRVTRGTAHGWGLWPLFSTFVRPGVSSETYALWPLVYRLSREPTPDDPPGTPPRRETGVLPFYASSTGPGFVSESYVWPLFGYTDRTQLIRYHERRYLWPFFMQGRGDERYVNRWAPFFTHSVVKGYEKRWFAWPLLRHARWSEAGIERTRSQFLYFVYWHEGQRVAGRTNSPRADLTHLWPLFSHWDNGAGRRQWQIFSPFEVFFPHNAKVRQIWSPLLAIARHDKRASGDSRTSLLWNAVTWEKQVAENRHEFHLGPLLGVTRAGAEKRVAFGHGLFGFERNAQGKWRLFWLDFPHRNRHSPAE